MMQVHKLYYYNRTNAAELKVGKTSLFVMQIHVDRDIKLCFIRLQFGPQRCINGQTIYTY
jgi:hypothetical protein